MAFFPEIYERCLKAVFYSGNFASIDIGFFLNTSVVLDIKIVESLPVNEGNAKLFFLGCIY